SLSALFRLYMQYGYWKTPGYAEAQRAGLGVSLNVYTVNKITEDVIVRRETRNSRWSPMPPYLSKMVLSSFLRIPGSWGKYSTKRGPFFAPHTDTYHASGSYPHLDLA